MNGSIKRNSLRYAFKRSIPIMIGFFPVGIAYGILMLEAGYGFLWSAGCSATVFAGSLQMLMVSFLAGGVPCATSAICCRPQAWRRSWSTVSAARTFPPQRAFCRSLFPLR